MTTRDLFQCSGCRRQTSPIAGTLFAGTKLPLRTWFRAIYHVTQTKQGISSIELGRRLGVRQNTAWTIKHKLKQAMMERDASKQLSGRVEIDDAYTRMGGDPPLFWRGTGRSLEPDPGEAQRRRGQGSFTQRYVKRHGRSRRFRPMALLRRPAAAFPKPSHGIQSEHRFPNTVYEHDFPRLFPGLDFGLIAGCSQFLGFRNMTPFRGWRYFFSGVNLPLENHAEIVRQNGGIKTAENGGLRRLSGQCHVALRTFE